jgi:hypothetical protein
MLGIELFLPGVYLKLRLGSFQGNDDKVGRAVFRRAAAYDGAHSLLIESLSAAGGLTP